MAPLATIHFSVCILYLQTLGESLEIDRKDQTFAVTTGLVPASYGRGGGCYSPYSDRAKGEFKLNLTGTGLAVSTKVCRT